MTTGVSLDEDSFHILVTGGAGFIGSNFVHHVLRERPGWLVMNLDRLTYAGNLENLADLTGHPHHRFVRGDVADREEVYGSLGSGEPPFTEDSPLRPNSPYAASKAAADLLCRAYHRTYGLPVVVTRCCNNFGPYQFPEKLSPFFVVSALEGRPLPVYGDGLQVRDWIQVEDHCAALVAVLERGRPGAVYNVGARCERTNLEVTRLILRLLGKPDLLIAHVADRPGHDRRYAIDPSRIEAELGWRPRRGFEEALAEGVALRARNCRSLSAARARPPEED